VEVAVEPEELEAAGDIHEPKVLLAQPLEGQLLAFRLRS
jgi:hypothetical protein